MADHNENVIYNDAHCFHVKVPDIGSAKAVYYDVAALQRSIRYCEKHGSAPVFYVLACGSDRSSAFYKEIRALNGVLYVNPTVMNGAWKMERTGPQILEGI
jgi:rhamnosyltransferase